MDKYLLHLSLNYLLSPEHPHTGLNFIFTGSMDTVTRYLSFLPSDIMIYPGINYYHHLYKDHIDINMSQEDYFIFYYLI